MKTLVVFYSFEGNTAIIADAIATTLKADLIRLVPEKEMESKGFSKFIWGGKQVFMKEKPKLKEFNTDFSEYETVFVGSPVWSWTYAPAIRTLVEDGYLKGKKVYFFCSHEGGVKGVETRAKALLEKDNIYMGFKDFNNVQKERASKVQDAINWVKSLSL